MWLRFLVRWYVCRSNETMSLPHILQRCQVLQKSSAGVSATCHGNYILHTYCPCQQGKPGDIFLSYAPAPMSSATVRYTHTTSWHRVVQRSLPAFIVLLHVCSPVFADHSQSRSICREISAANTSDRIPHLLVGRLRIPIRARGRTHTGCRRWWTTWAETQGNVCWCDLFLKMNQEA